MREIPIEAQRRDSVGKGFARRARMAGQIPGVIYGPEVDSVAIAVEEREFRTAMKTADKASILNLSIDGKETKVVVRAMQRDPITNRVTHIDFHAISMTRPINVSIPINFVGDPIGVKIDGGIMQTTMRELDISCLPTDIPDHFEINVSELGIGTSIHVKDISIDKVEILAEEQRTIVVISAPTVIKADAVEEDEELEGELAEGEVAEGAEGEAAEGDDKKADDAKPGDKKADDKKAGDKKK